MKKEGKTKTYYTVWLMKDRTARPVQYRVSRESLRLAAGLFLLFLLVGLVVLPGLLYWSHSRNLALRAENQRLEEIAGRYQVSEEALAKLEKRVGEMEGLVNQTCERTESVLSAIEAEVARWLPSEGVGGAGKGMGGPSEPFQSSRSAKSSRPHFSSAQLERLKSIQEKIEELEDKIEVNQYTATAIEEAWEERNSVFEAFPSKWPVEGGYISSGFGRRVHPLTGRYQMHEGVDIVVPYGSPVYAAAPGDVIFSGRREGYGKAILIDHGFGLSTFYAHLSRIFVKPGQRVEKGEKIGAVGNTGYSTGPHLHFEVRMKDIPVNPLRYLNPFSENP